MTGPFDRERLEALLRRFLRRRGPARPRLLDLIAESDRELANELERLWREWMVEQEGDGDRTY